MSLITAPSSSLSIVDPVKILHDSLSNERPFNVPTVILRPEEFSEFSKQTGRLHRFSRVDMVAHMQRRISEFFNRQKDIAPETANNITQQYVEVASEDILVQVVSNLIVPQYVQSGCVLLPFKGIEGPFAHQLHAEYQDASSGLVFTFSQSVSGRTYGESMISLAEGELPEMPGSDAEWQHLLLWHEFAHTSGAAEPQADKMAAIVSRKAFDRADMIRAFADQRMVKTVLNHHSDVDISYYGLPLVEGLDEVADMPKEQIDGVSDIELRDIRFETHDYKSAKVRAFGAALTDEFPNEFDLIREKRKPITMGVLSAFRDKSEWLVEHTDLSDDLDCHVIAERFVVAIDRLSVGVRAYC